MMKSSESFAYFWKKVNNSWSNYKDIFIKKILIFLQWTILKIKL